MALHDWNNDGKKDIKDDFIEYTIYNDITKDSKNNHPKAPTKKGISTFGAVLSTILGLVLIAFVFTIFDVNIDNVPTFLIIIFWIINSSILSVICDIFGI